MGKVVLHVSNPDVDFDESAEKMADIDVKHSQ